MVIKKIIFWLSILLLFETVCVSLFAEEKAIVVVVNKDNSVDNLTKHELAEIYKGEKQKWPNEEKITVLNYPYDAVIRSYFYDAVLNAKPTQKYFLKGSPIPFTTMILESEATVLKFVARVPNAIAYVYFDKVDDTVKVLKIDGAAPTEVSYKLKDMSVDKDE